jgi:DNA-binding XRE family transcriptional regulator
MAHPHPKVHNQIKAVMQHCPEFWFKGPQAKLSREAGISSSAISSIVNGQDEMLVSTALCIVHALREITGKLFFLEDIIALHPFPQDAACRIMGCTGCSYSKPHPSDESAAGSHTT